MGLNIHFSSWDCPFECGYGPDHFERSNGLHAWEILKRKTQIELNNFFLNYIILIVKIFFSCKIST